MKKVSFVALVLNNLFFNSLIVFLYLTEIYNINANHIRIRHVKRLYIYEFLTSLMVTLKFSEIYKFKRTSVRRRKRIRIYMRTTSLLQIFGRKVK